MADDQTQSQGGGFLSEIGQGLTKALPYALDAGIGAALGGPMGAVAGLARAGGTTEEQQRQQEIGMRQQELGLQIQQFGLEKQKMLGALQTEQNYQDFVDSQPKEDQAMLRAVPPEARGAVIMDKIQSGEWKNSLGMMDDPQFLQAHNLTSADVSILRNLPPKQGNQLFGEMLKAGQQNNLEAMRYIHQQALEAQREGAAAGRQATSEAAQDARQTRAEAAADARQAKSLQARKDADAARQAKALSPANARIKALGEYNKYVKVNPPPLLTGYGMRADKLKAWQDQAIASLKSEGIPADAAEQVVRPPNPASGGVSPAASDFLKKHGISG